MFKLTEVFISCSYNKLKLLQVFISCRYNRFKLIEGSPGEYSDWIPPPLHKSHDIKLFKRKHLLHERHINQTLLFNVEGESLVCL